MGSSEKPIRPALLKTIYHGKATCHLSKALPGSNSNPGIWLTQIELLVYNYAAPAKNRWGDTVYPQLPHTSAHS
jgi:hypothetical protein